MKVETKPIVVTPDYDDAHTPVPGKVTERAPSASQEPMPQPQGKIEDTKAGSSRNPLGAYGERSSSRPYALRLPEPIDLALRQIAAEERTHPLRIVDRLIHDHLQQIGKLPPHGEK